MTLRASSIKQLREVERLAHGGGYERVHWEVARDIINHGESGLLGLQLGPGGWGIDWTGYEGEIPADPAEINWRGPTNRKGKRWMDGPGPPVGGFGGLGMAHIDSSWLKRVYKDWGYPHIPRTYVEGRKATYDRIRKHRDYWEPWREWATELLSRDEFHLYVAHEWVRIHWQPNWDAYVAERHEWLESIKRTSVMARLSNSLSRTDDRLREKSPLPTVEEAAKVYYDYKLKRSIRAAERTTRSVRLALRLGAVCGELRIQPF